MKTGIKVTKATKDISSTDIRDFILHSEYPMFKIHEVSSGSITINAGESSGTTTINHSLGYVPAFLVYENNSLFPSNIDCYATNTGITITNRLNEPYNQTTYDYNDWLYYYAGGLPDAGIITGNLFGSNYDSFVRFVGININQGQIITSANFEFTNVRTTTGSDIKFRTYGIDEDNTADYGGDPSGRPLTSTYNQKTQSPNSNYFNFSDNWTNQFQEIVDRPGWSNGNAMGFKFQQDGTTDNHIMYFDKGSSNYNLTLKVTLPGSLTTNYKIVIFKDKIHS